MSGSVVEIKLTAKSLKDLKELRSLVGRRVFLRETLKFMDRQASIGADYISDNFASGQRLGRRTGNLAKSIIGRSVMASGVPAIRIGVMRGPALRYAGVQEYGTKGKNPSSPFATIRPKNAKALAIPVGPSLTGVGVDRFGGPRNVPFDLRFIPFRGTGVAVGGLFDPRTLPQSGSGLTLQSAKMYYLLLKKVDIEPKWYLKDGFEAWMPNLINELADYLRDFLRGVKAKRGKRGS